MPERYVSRAGLKLSVAAAALSLDFADKIILDVGSSTGGFTDYALQHGAKKVIAIESGTNQLHASLRGNPNIDLREKTDIRDVKKLPETPDIIVIDVSFISLRQILPYIFTHLCGKNTVIAAMVKPQFEAKPGQLNRGVIKNNTVRRQIFKDFEQWVKQHAVVIDKADNELSGASGNRERFYVLKTKR